MADDAPQFLSKIAETAMRHWKRAQLLKMLPVTFGELDQHMFEEIEAKLEWVEFDRGECLLRQGESVDNLFILVTGRLFAAITNIDGNERVVGEIMPGESLGEMELFTGETAAANVYAARDSELVKLPKATFEQLAQSHLSIMRQITQLVIQRLRRANQSVSPKKAHTGFALDIVLYPASPDIPMDEFAHRLSAALNTMGSTLLLDNARFDEYLGRPGSAQIKEGTPEDARLVVWLNHQETQYRFIIYQADFTLSEWTQRCMRQADHVLIVGDATKSPILGDLESELHRKDKIGIRRHLVLLHPSNADRPRGTERWLEKISVDRHHHIRIGRDADIERLARFVAGQAIGLVLSGGGARGFAHIGVLRALNEASIPIDIIGGNSAGTLVAAQYAIGWNPERIHQENRPFAKKPIKLMDFTVPLLSIDTGRKQYDSLMNFFGDIQIEDMWTPFFCVSSNLTRAEIVVHRTGPLWRGVKASNSLPGMAPPVVQNGDLLVDGTFLNDLPVDVMYDFCDGGSVIAVNVSPPVDLKDNPDYGDHVSGLKLLWRRINPFVPAIKTPNIVALVQRAGELSSIRDRKYLLRRELADHYLSPPLADFELMDYTAIDELVQTGYEYAVEEISKWPSSIP